MSKATMTIEGFVSKNPELGQHQGKAVVNVDVPHTPRRLNKQTNQWEDAGDTLWVQASFWEADAEAIAAQVRKGSLVTITGQPELNVYAKNDGSSGASLRLKFATLGVIPRAEQPDKWAQANSYQPQQQPVADSWATQQPGAYGDDTPF